MEGCRPSNAGAFSNEEAASEALGGLLVKTGKVALMDKSAERADMRST
ncbi:hypothetical protein [Rhizobium laguerreae]|uniref:Uncharacterized protein n=1 Tax=Rhizobium laguerreae TaxID=1076926 RepID=A0A7Y2R7N3_9HYPH|nr:hypothetical protein [Rhizobium laguerreae]NDK52368.1 hypothetical protein [Rhizobium laguerreae]NNH65752.1 hypothetical protein [Rhizobium laguerreae]